MNHTIVSRTERARAAPPAQRAAAAGKTGSMSGEQYLDYTSAREGRMTWRAYFAKWGGPAPSSR